MATLTLGLVLHGVTSAPFGQTRAARDDQRRLRGGGPGPGGHRQEDEAAVPDEHGDGFSYQFVSADPSGRHVLFDAGTTRTGVNGWIDRGKLIRLRPAGNNVFSGAW